MDDKRKRLGPWQPSGTSGRRAGPILYEHDCYTPRPLLSPLDAALAFLAILVLALAGGLAAYLTAHATEAHLLAQGFTPWPESRLSPDITTLPSPFAAPSSDILYRYVPDQKLSYAFMTLPGLRGIATAVIIAIGGLLVLAAARSTAQKRHIALVASAFFVIAGMAAILPDTPQGFSIDLGKGELIHTQAGNVTTMPIADITRFSEQIASSEDILQAVDANHKAFDIISLNLGADTATLLNQMQDFLATGGRQL